MHTLKSILDGRSLYSVETGQTVMEVARRMATLKVGAILVLDGGALKGLFSERDLMTRVVVAGRGLDSTRVGDVMSSNLAVIDERASTEDAMSLMRRAGCRHLPVLRGRDVVGMVSMRDLMNLELEDRVEEITHMRSYIQSA